MPQLQHNVTEHDFDERVLDASYDRPVLVQYGAAEDEVVSLQYALLHELMLAFNQGFVLVQVDTGSSLSLAKDYGLHEFPALKLFYKGVVAETLQGEVTEDELRRTLQRVLPRPSDEALNEALVIYQSGDSARALETLTQALESDPYSLRLALTLGGMLANESRSQQALHMIDALPDEVRADEQMKNLHMQLGFMSVAEQIRDVEQLEEQLYEETLSPEGYYQLACLNIANENFPAAVEMLFEVIKYPATEKTARHALDNLFYLLGEDHYLVKEHRLQL